jgi:hypothetical protein
MHENVVMEGGVPGGAVLARERERCAHRGPLRGDAVGEVATLEQEQAGADVRFGLDLVDRRAEQLVVRVLAQHRLVPWTQRVHQLVRLREPTASLGLVLFEEDRPLLEPQRAQQPPPWRADPIR